MLDKISEIQTVSEWEIVLASHKLVLAYFFSENVAPCAQSKLMLQSIIAQYSHDLGVFSINVNKNVTVACMYRITIVPTMFFFKGKQKLHELITLVSEEQLSSILLSFLGKSGS